jgi:starvation-inducible DNA-binding protein
MPVLDKLAVRKSSIHIPAEKREAILEVLIARMSDSIDLRTQIKFAHWNVKGKDFIQLHELFDGISAHVDTQSDTLAERIAALGGVAPGTAREVAVASSLPEADLKAVSGTEHLRWLTKAVALHANQIREAIDRTSELGDAVTADIFTQVGGELDKDVWFLEAHLISE